MEPNKTLELGVYSFGNTPRRADGDFGSNRGKRSATRLRQCALPRRSASNYRPKAVGRPGAHAGHRALAVSNLKAVIRARA